MLLHDVGVGVSDADSLTLLDNIELFVKGHHLDTAILVADDALGHAIEAASVVSSALANHADRVHSEVHVDARAWLQLRHGDEDGLAKRWPLLLWLAVGIVAWLPLTSFHHFHVKILGL